MPGTTGRRYFGRPFFAFLEELAANNRRDWFQENKERFEEVVKDPALAFISDFGPHLAEVSRHFRADPRPVGGSLFRIYRDVRFSKDKSPYKTHVGIHFRHESSKDAHAPGYYLHLGPAGSFAGVGIWRPDAASLQRIRDAIVERPARWRSIFSSERFTARFAMAGESLQRAPRGYDPEHPLIEDLKRKDFHAGVELGRDEVGATDFLERFARIAADGRPLARFLCEALAVPF